MDSKYDVSIIIVNYNGKKYLDNLFTAIEGLECEDFCFETVFVDNNSTDGSLDYLSEKSVSEKIHLNIVRSDKNLGFAGGNNLGVSKSQGEYIIFLNNDTAPTRLWLRNLYHFFITHDYGIVNSKLLFFYDFIKLTFKTQDKIVFDRDIIINNNKYLIEDKFCKNLLCQKKEIVAFGHSEISLPILDKSDSYRIELSCSKFDAETDALILCGKKIPFDNNKISISLSKNELESFKYSLIQNAGSFVNKNYDGGDIGFGEQDSAKFRVEYEISNACGAAMMLKKSDFESVGCFDERFFMYYEDTDLSYRIKKLEKKIAFCPDAIVRHVHTGSSTEWSPFFLYHVIRNKILFVWKNISKAKALYFLCRQYASGVKHHDRIKRRASLDALRIILHVKNISYRGDLK